jgi:hypothetical protein
VIGVAVGQDDHPQVSALELPKDTPFGPSGGRIDQHITGQVDVEHISGPAGQLPEAVSKK